MTTIIKYKSTQVISEVESKIRICDSCGERVDVSTLNEGTRQPSGGWLILSAHPINDGDYALRLPDPLDFCSIECLTEAVNKIKENLICQHPNKN